MDFPIYELRISDKVQDDAEISAVALVDAPAIKRDFLAFKEHLKFEVLSETDNILAGPLMIPEQLIYRNSEKFGEHYVKFSVDTIFQCALKYAKKSLQCSVNIMHDAAMTVENVTMFNNFVTNEKYGIQPLAKFSDLPWGTWFGIFKVENPQVMDSVKSGLLKGFSVEGMFDYEAPMTPEQQKLHELKKLLNSF